MLTRIEIDGFKTFEDFALDVTPFFVVVGANASGKSNLFDALRLLSKLAGQDLRSAVSDLRGEVNELFRSLPGGIASPRIRLAAELLVPPKARDPWGAEVEVTHTRIRYEVTLERREDSRGVERLVVAHEAATPIFSSKDRWQAAPNAPSRAFRETFMRYKRQSAWISTDAAEQRFEIHQDGGAGRKRNLPAVAAEATVLSSITTSAEFPHLFALREELRSWRFLQLDPSSLRRPSEVTAPETLLPDGSNLATVLARIKADTATPERPKGLLPDIAAALGRLIPGVVEVNVEEDKQNREYRIDIGQRDDGRFSSRVASDGTLRLLALLTALYDPKQHGVVYFEEPENGVHPARLKSLIADMRSLVADPSADDVDPEAALTQVVLNSHSPVVVSQLAQVPLTDGEMVFADLITVTDPTSGSVRRKTRMRAVRPSDQGELAIDKAAEYVTPYEVSGYLASVEREG